MSKFQKSNMTVDGNKLHLSMPFAKVDKARRLVSGFATLDNIDSQGDIVLAEASAKAFARARGNIREMHQPIAVGKMVDFREEEFVHVDPVSQETKFYRGIFVTVRVSEGAEDTWKKVLDETLTGFSIGGEINEAEHEFNKEANKTIRFIKDYDLTELSLVDNPANQLANVLSIQKSATGVTVTMGEASDTKVENVFICDEDNTIIVKDTESENCPSCGTKMNNAGWFESETNRTEKVRDIVSKYLTPDTKEATPSDSEGGVDMSKKEDKKDNEVSSPNPSEEFPDGTKVDPDAVATVAEEGDESAEEEGEESANVDEAAGTEEEEAESPEEVEDDESKIVKQIEELKESVTATLEESKTETLKKVEELEGKVNEATQQFLTKASELESKMGEFGQKLETAKSRQAELESMLEKFNSSEAMRKSADLEGPAETVVQKDASWNGAFSGKSGKGFSVDNLM